MHGHPNVRFLFPSQSARRYIPGDLNLHQQTCEILKSCIFKNWKTHRGCCCMCVPPWYCTVYRVVSLALRNRIFQIVENSACFHLLERKLKCGNTRGLVVGEDLFLVSLIRYRMFYTSASQLLWDRDPVNSFFIRRGPSPYRFTRQYLSNFFLSSYIKLT